MTRAERIALARSKQRQAAALLLEAADLLDLPEGKARTVPIAALYVMPRGCYVGLPDVDPWDEARDARRYPGPHPVVAHPPCERWGRYAAGGPYWLAQGRPPKILGDDGGCFAAALAAVRQFGGVLEHPADSHAWAAHGLLAPPRAGGWVAAGDFLGWTCCVDQGHYGHRASKATWLYAVAAVLPSLVWGPARRRLPLPEDPTARRRALKTGVCQNLSRAARLATPLPFRDLLLSIARSVRRG